MQARRDRLLAVLKAIGEGTSAEIIKHTGTTYNVFCGDTDALIRAGRVSKILHGSSEATYQLADRAPLLSTVWPAPKLPAYDRSRVISNGDRHMPRSENTGAEPWTGYSSSLNIGHLAW